MSSASSQPTAGPDRRTVVAAVGAAGLAAALTACGSGDDSADAGPADAGTAATGAAPDGGGTALARTADIPEGGGKIFKDRGVVVTQPTAGTYKAFSAECTHQGCAVGSVKDGTIVCPCHGSEFSVSDGSVRKGPATKGLAPARITVSGDDIRLA
ncbi:Rieske (2Fe-2S) protein [Streptomyces rubradiris]|uniref:Cytochrome bc1 complex Rieske iron-sulfur subunit n=1 Tax=Streptomyces rubradiris TaxID=285531 RepID=A0ABQ3R5B0_STRRR|nr:Rieske (2Fe-2S) protein [Streptomyces rubradiris]GHH26905.1 iron-sulfur protein [Streptomyces rubradiris]GHI51034.1 iron-sulfur protein [Streptomyces rubradiris]